MPSIPRYLLACGALIAAACDTTPAPNPAVVEMVTAPTSGRAMVLSGGRRMPGAEIETRLSGQTLQDVWQSFTWRFSPDGTYVWAGNGGKDGTWYSSGTWEVVDDTLCWTIDGYDMGCRAMFEWKGVLRMSTPEGGLEPWAVW